MPALFRALCGRGQQRGSFDYVSRVACAKKKEATRESGGSQGMGVVVGETKYSSSSSRFFLSFLDVNSDDDCKTHVGFF